MDVSLKSENRDALSLLFAEELGCVIEVHPDAKDTVVHRYQASGVSCSQIGKV